MADILRNEEKILFALRELYAQYGYQHFKMNRFEEYDLYVRNKDFLLSDQIITFSDRSGRLLAMKPDVILSIIKNIQDKPGAVQKLYYNENVYRMDKGAQGYKEIMQAGLECVGEVGLFDTTEVVLLAAKSLQAMTLPFVLDISHIGFINAVLDAGCFSKDIRSDILLLLHQKNEHEMRQLCKRCNVDQGIEQLLCALISTSGNPMYVISVLEPLLFTKEQQDELLLLRSVCDTLIKNGFEASVNIDFSTGSQMNYYSGIVFCGYLQGVPNSVLSGGQYDSLLRRMGKRSNAVGFAIYLDQLQRVWKNANDYDVDIVLLYDKSIDYGIIADVANELRQNATVRVATAIPEDITFDKIMRIQQGKAVLVDEYS